MTLIDEIEEQIWQLHDTPIWTRDDVRRILAPLAEAIELADLDAITEKVAAEARQAVECVETMKKHARIEVCRWKGGGWGARFSFGGQFYDGNSLVAAIEEAAKHVAEQEKRDG